MGRLALRAHPLTDRKVFDLPVLVPATGARLATGEERRYFDQRPLRPIRLVFQHPEEFAHPASEMLFASL